jgi:hypothetical protein
MDQGLDRRDFHKLSLAALGGVLAGAAAGCGGAAPPSGPSGPPAVSTNEQTYVEQLLTDEPHVCRGLNTCKGLGRSKENECAGLGTCATMADASCGGNNACQGQGGCGELPGMNSCKGKGGCHIPLMDQAWDKARESFEAAMKKSGKKFGPAPAKVEKEKA